MRLAQDAVVQRGVSVANGEQQFIPLACGLLLGPRLKAGTRWGGIATERMPAFVVGGPKDHVRDIEVP